jgi:pimeloyl-ACP methyl ester carboxylesterase
VVGFSTGGSVALQLAIDHPDVVRRLALVSAACRLGPEGREVQARIAALVREGRRREASGLMMSVLAVSEPARRALTVAGRLLAPVLMRDDLDDMLATIDAEDAFDATSWLPEVGAPTLVVGGAHERFSSRRTLEEVLRFLGEG